jgi:uncharacterized membrane protein YgcG
MIRQGVWRAGVVGSVFAVVLAFVAVLPAHADVNSFSFSDFEADYYLSKDDSGRSTMTVTEQLTAQFPLTDQNKGIVRALPMSYDDHSVSLNFDNSSLTRNGLPEPVYDRSIENGNLNISTGTEQYVHGAQTYKYTYHMRDVTKDFDDHQELYWDTNGTEWTQSFDKVVARVHLDPSVAAAWSSGDDCYEGPAGSQESCDIQTGQDSDGHTMLTFTSTRQFGSGENMTFVLGFDSGTFTPYQMGALDWFLAGLAIAVAVLSLASIIWAIILKATHRNAKGRGTIIPEYQPPKNVAVLVAGQLYAKTNKGIAAQIIDLAVRQNIQIVEYDKTGFFGTTSKAYKLRFLNADGLGPDEQEFAEILFDELKAGQEYDMGDTIAARSTGTALGLYQQTLGKDMVKRGYRYNIRGRMIPIVISIIITVVSFILSIALSDSVASGYSGMAALLAFVSIFITSILVGGTLPLTESGVGIRDYVKGLKLYITVAEEDRLKFLQSVTGAERKDLGNLDDHAQLVKLYEKLLPYAVLFGLEKSWGKVMEQYYDNPDVSPAWYIGAGAFSMSDFTSSISTFAASTSSSSSGLGGGGGSGGGGGGGGGGGR